jgi:hypothetical protein
MKSIIKNIFLYRGLALRTSKIHSSEEKNFGVNPRTQQCLENTQINDNILENLQIILQN